jgi:hypothetical protein
MPIKNKRLHHVKAYWGPRLWYLLHKITYNYPEMPSIYEQQYYLNYFNFIQRVIPCQYCAAHYKLSTNLRPLRVSLTNRCSTIAWFCKLHNDINIENKKRIYQVSELDIMYGTNDFNHNLFHELIDYMFELVLSNELHRQVFLYWIIMTYHIHPCVICKANGIIFIQNCPVENINYMDNNVLQTLIDRIKYVSHHE